MTKLAQWKKDDIKRIQNANACTLKEAKAKYILLQSLPY